jgi:hypothetical protein
MTAVAAPVLQVAQGEPCDRLVQSAGQHQGLPVFQQLFEPVPTLFRAAPVVIGIEQQRPAALGYHRSDQLIGQLDQTG